MGPSLWFAWLMRSLCGQKSGQLRSTPKRRRSARYPAALSSLPTASTKASSSWRSSSKSAFGIHEHDPEPILDDIERQLTATHRPLDEAHDAKLRFGEQEAIARARGDGGKGAHRERLGLVMQPHTAARHRRQRQDQHPPAFSHRPYLSAQNDSAPISGGIFRALRADVVFTPPSRSPMGSIH